MNMDLPETEPSFTKAQPGDVDFARGDAGDLTRFCGL